MYKYDVRDFEQRVPPIPAVRRRTYQLDARQISPVVNLCIRGFGPPYYERHTYDFMFWLILEGEMRLEIDGESHRAGPYELVWVPPFVRHGHGGVTPFHDRIAIHFDLAPDVPGEEPRIPDRKPYEVKLPDDLVLPRKFVLSPTHPVVSLALGMPLVFNPPTGQLAVECNANLHLILAILFRTSAEGERIRAFHLRRNEQIKRAVSYAQKHFRTDPELSVDDLAQASGLGRSRFEHLFREQTGVSPMVFVRRLRVDYAKNLLTDFEMPIKNVGAASGFSDAFSFSRVFKQVTGRSPSQFRTLLEKTV